MEIEVVEVADVSMSSKGNQKTDDLHGTLTKLDQKFRGSMSVMSDPKTD